MSDDTTKTSPPDAEFISLTEAYDIAYGTKKFGVSDDHLAEAVRRADHSAAAIEAPRKT